LYDSGVLNRQNPYSTLKGKFTPARTNYNSKNDDSEFGFGRKGFNIFSPAVDIFFRTKLIYNNADQGSVLSSSDMTYNGMRNIHIGSGFLEKAYEGITTLYDGYSSHGINDYHTGYLLGFTYNGIELKTESFDLWNGTFNMPSVSSRTESVNIDIMDTNERWVRMLLDYYTEKYRHTIIPHPFRDYFTLILEVCNYQWETVAEWELYCHVANWKNVWRGQNSPTGQPDIISLNMSIFGSKLRIHKNTNNNSSAEYLSYGLPNPVSLRNAITREMIQPSPRNPSPSLIQ
jgi:hypothetical protein